MEKTIIRKRFQHTCEKCNFTAHRPAEWLIHIETNKHKQDGKPKSRICELCNITFANHWIQKMHMLKLHASQEDRAKSQYYCQVCDLIFFSPLFLDKHINGKIHLNLVRAMDSIKAEAKSELNKNNI